MTFSILGRCPRTGMMGMAVSSSSPAVAARCAHARAGAGVVGTQNITDPRLGPQGLALMGDGLPAEAALARLVATAPHVRYRQLLLLDRTGGSAGFSGEGTLGLHPMARGNGCIAGGNMLASAEVPARMVAAFEAAAEAPLGERLVRTMEAGLAAGGEAGPVHSAGLVMVRDVPWNVADLRVDWEESGPIAALRALWERWQPQMDDYVRRALDPREAPSYGVPGDP